MDAIFAFAIYGMLIASYLLLIALAFFGVFAVYQMLREHVNGHGYKRMEV